jgi:hypothetical protein
MKQMRKRKHHSAAAEQQIKTKSVFWQKFFPILAAVILAGIPFVAGKYIEFNSAGAFDSGAYVYSAEHILRGAKIGVDEAPSAQAGTLLVNILGVKLFGFDDFGSKVIQMLMQAAALVFMFFTSRKIFGSLAAIVSVTIASLYLSSPLIAKFGNVKEQFMIALMIIGICCYLRRQIGGNWLWAFFSGVFLVYGPTFKPTGLSAIFAVGIFTLVQPIFKNRTIKQTIADILLLFAGAAAAMLPVYIWLFGWHGTSYYPYQFIPEALGIGFKEAKLGGSYVQGARNLSKFSEQFARVMRYYGLLILPISIALLAIIVRLFRGLLQLTKKIKTPAYPFEKFIFLLGLWWLFDMAFVWISPRSYEEYYLPLNASAAMLGGYIFAMYTEKFRNAKNKIGYVLGGIVGLIVMLSMGWHIVFGIAKSPHSGQNYGKLTRGYVQRIDEIKLAKQYNYKGDWEQAAEYIKQNSAENDTIWVWGWYPGVYMKAQRFSCTAKPFMSDMFVMTPAALKDYMAELVSDLSKGKPKYIVDTHKIDYPWNIPALELWPRLEKGFLPNDAATVQYYESNYMKMVEKQFGKTETDRFAAMKQTRDFIMQNYTPVKIYGQFIVFELKNK